MVSDANQVQVELTIPIFNEERALESSIRRLHHELQWRLPVSHVVTIADNASTDRSWEIATRLATELPGVRAVRIPQKGRGGALRHVWTRSEATVVAYTDVDLSIDLDALAPMIASVLSGHSDLAIGTRYAQGSYVERNWKRAVLSRGYNALLRRSLGARFSDAQCGMKVVRRDVAADLVPDVEDDKWFFDTELLLLAQRRGLRIHEVPIVCLDDPDSTVHVVRDSAANLTGMRRMTRRLVAGEALPWFPLVAGTAAVVHAGVHARLRAALSAPAANAAGAVVAAGLMQTTLDLFAFGSRGAAGAIRHQLDVWGGLAAGLGLSTAALAAARAARPDSAALHTTAVLLAAALGVPVARLLLRPVALPSHGPAVRADVELVEVHPLPAGVDPTADGGAPEVRAA